jgi:Rrf2 family transcriptional regulator, iron-sulfur cluster assembly transcription factor
MLLSKSCIYGLRASVLLAKKNSSEYITINDLSKELNISFHFLTKVLQQLTKADLLISFKGPNGGVKLAKPADQITFREIIISIDEKFTLTDCPLGLPACGEFAPCPLHDNWQKLQAYILQMTNSVTLAELSLRQKQLHDHQNASVNN